MDGDTDKSLVFISYRRSDVATARALADLLETFGQRVFLDVAPASIRPGDKWEGAIERAAGEAGTMLVLWSRNAIHSTYLPREWAMRSPSCRLIPIRLDDSELPAELASHQGVTLNPAERLASRVAQLTKEGLSHRKANQQLLDELKKDGFQLDREQEKHVLAFAAAVAVSTFGLATAASSWGPRAVRAAVSAAAAGTIALIGGAGYGIARFATLKRESDTCNVTLAALEKQVHERAEPPGPGAAPEPPRVVHDAAPATKEPVPHFSAETLVLTAHSPAGPAKAPFRGRPDTQSLKITNAVGGGPLQIKLGSILPRPPFAIHRNGCSEAVAPGGSCEIQVEFAPTVVAGSSGTVELLLNTTPERHVVSLRGRVLCPVPDVSPLTSSNDVNNTITKAGFQPNIALKGKGNALKVVSQSTPKGTEADCNTSLTVNAQAFDIIP
jgi:hypothetical protein